MARTTKAQAEAETRLLAAFEAGIDYYAENPDAVLAEIYREATKRYSANKNEAMEFAMGYCNARRQRDDFLREKKQ